VRPDRDQRPHRAPVLTVLEAVASWQGVEPGEGGEAAPEITHTIIRRSAMTFRWPQSPARMSTDEFMEWLETATSDELESFADDADGVWGAVLPPPNPSDRNRGLR